MCFSGKCWDLTIGGILSPGLATKKITKFPALWYCQPLPQVLELYFYPLLLWRSVEWLVIYEFLSLATKLSVCVYSLAFLGKEWAWIHSSFWKCKIKQTLPSTNCFWPVFDHRNRNPTTTISNSKKKYMSTRIQSRPNQNNHKISV